MTGAATPTTASSPGYTVSSTAVSGPAVAKVPVIGTGWWSVPVAVTVYSAPNASFCVSVQLLRSAEIAPVIGVPSAAVIVRVSITPWVTVTVTGPAGAIPVLPNAGVAVTVATGGAGVRAVPATAVLSAAPTGSDVTGMLGSVVGPAVTVAVADVGGV